MSPASFSRSLVLAGVFAASATGGAGGAQDPRPADQPTFSAGVEMVVVDVVVTATRGGPIPGLRREDFAVSENGVPQEIQTFEAVDVAAGAAGEEDAAEVIPRVSLNTGLQAMNARSFVLVLDQDHLSPLGAIRAKAAIAEFLRFGPRDGDTVMIVGTGGGSWWVTRAGEAKAELGALLKGVQGRSTTQGTPDTITDFEAMRIWQDRDPVVQEQVRRRFESYATGRQRLSEGFPVRGSDRLTDSAGQELVSSEEILHRANEAYQMSIVRNRTTLVSLARVLDSMGAVRGRKTVVLFSEGFIRDPRLEEHDAVIRTAQRANVALYFVDVRGLEAMPLSATAQFGTQLPASDVAEQMSQGLLSTAGADDLANRTGGFSIKNTNDLERGLLGIAQEARRYYLLGYVPKDTRADGRWRKIAVTVARPDVTVRARQGYFGPGGDPRRAERTRGTWRPGLQQALDSPYEFQGVPLRLTHHLFGEAAGKARALLTAEVDIRGLAFEERKDKSVDTLEYLLAVVHRESGAVQRQDQKIELQLPSDVRAALEARWLPVSKEFELAPGRYQARLAVRDTRGGTVGSIRHDFDVPDLGGWRTSTPVLSDALEPRTEGAPLAPVIPARRAFTGDTLYYQFEVYGSGRDAASGLPRVNAGFTLRTEEGTAVMRVDPALIRPTADGRLARLGMVPLAGKPPGQYELVLDLRDEVTGRAMEVRERFSIEARP